MAEGSLYIFGRQHLPSVPYIHDTLLCDEVPFIGAVTHEMYVNTFIRLSNEVHDLGKSVSERERESLV